MDFKSLFFSWKIIFVNTLLCICAFPSLAQEEGTPALGIIKLIPSGVEIEEAENVSNRIEIAFFNSNRFQIVTRQILEAIEVERERSKEAVNLDDMIIQQEIAIGANYILKGKVTRYDRNTQQSKPNRTTSRQPSPPKIYTSTLVHFSLQIVEVKSGVIKAGATYKGSLNKVDHFVKNFIRKEFPFRLTILEVLKEKEEKKKTSVLLDGGFKQGLYNSVMLNVYEVIPETFEGITVNREVPIGKMVVKAVDFSGNFSQCVIKKGRKTIVRKLDEGKTLICKVPKKLRFMGMKFEYNY
ncbi:MAG: CsgG/HfaB family protein [Saprospiraceae bacterium]